MNRSLSRCEIWGGCLLILGLPTSWAQTTDAVPVAPLSARSAPPVPPDGPPNDTARSFVAAYHRTGDPRIAILYNRELGVQLAAWTMDPKTVVTETAAPGLRMLSLETQYAAAPHSPNAPSPGANQSTSHPDQKLQAEFSEDQTDDGSESLWMLPE